MQIPTFDLTGKTAIVTGATKGLGYGFSMALANAGADIVVVSRTKVDCENVAAEIRALGRKALACPTDVSQKDSLEKLVETVLNQFGKIDILVNNAGVAVTEKAEKLEEKDWDWVMDVNLKSVFLLSQLVGRAMIEQKSGKIINVSSMLGLVGDKAVLPYLASKGGVIQLTRGLALEWARYNIQVNAIAPGYVITSINEKEFADEKVYKYITGKIPLNRLGQVEEISGSVVFLSSKASDYITGAVLPIDGGWTAQ